MQLSALLGCIEKGGTNLVKYCPRGSKYYPSASDLEYPPESEVLPMAPPFQVSPSIRPREFNSKEIGLEVDVDEKRRANHAQHWPAGNLVQDLVC